MDEQKYFEQFKGDNGAPIETPLTSKYATLFAHDIKNDIWTYFIFELDEHGYLIIPEGFEVPDGAHY